MTADGGELFRPTDEILAEIVAALGDARRAARRIGGTR